MTEEMDELVGLVVAAPPSYEEVEEVDVGCEAGYMGTPKLVEEEEGDVVYTNPADDGMELFGVRLLEDESVSIRKGLMGILNVPIWP